MGNLKNSDLVEIVFWLLIAVIFFSVSFNFNQPIEIYKFGATGWPRVILALIGLAALGNLYHSFKNGSKTQQGRVGASEAPDQVYYSSLTDYLKTAWILVIPLLYAISLKPVGFYFGTPFFIALVMLACGDRLERYNSFSFYQELNSYHQSIHNLYLRSFHLIFQNPLIVI